ncbi:MAG: Smr/MutS family protein [Sphingobium sp.]|nr:Smr/MutS family protein [Sphingobium sp.]MCP5398287.1 Smr/MutS family protein [Sphingomonas sp.]
MVGRPLSPEEQLIWSKVTQSVDPLAGRASPKALVEPSPHKPDAQARGPNDKKAGTRAPAPPAPAKATPVARLDDSWERRISNGSLMPEMSVDLHGYTLQGAHMRLNQALSSAVARGVRVLLVITGNPRTHVSGAGGQSRRGAIRAEIGDWLALSGHAEAIASVRIAHPRHGGRGALYVILRRKK